MGWYGHWASIYEDPEAYKARFGGNYDDESSLDEEEEQSCSMTEE